MPEACHQPFHTVANMYANPPDMTSMVYELIAADPKLWEERKHSYTVATEENKACIAKQDVANTCVSSQVTINQSSSSELLSSDILLTSSVTPVS